MDLRSKNKQNAYKATLDAIAMDYNENHDPSDGRFTSGGSGSSGSSAGSNMGASTRAKVFEGAYRKHDGGKSLIKELNSIREGEEQTVTKGDKTLYFAKQSNGLWKVSEQVGSGAKKGISVGSPVENVAFRLSKYFDTDDEFTASMDMLTGDFNPNHDPGDGRFTSGGSGSSGKSESLTDKLLALNSHGEGPEWMEDPDDGSSYAREFVEGEEIYVRISSKRDGSFILVKGFEDGFEGDERYDSLKSARNDANNWLRRRSDYLKGKKSQTSTL